MAGFTGASLVNRYLVDQGFETRRKRVFFLAK